MDEQTVLVELVVRFLDVDELWQWHRRAMGRRSRRVSIPIEDGDFVGVSAGRLALEIRRRAEATARREAGRAKDLQIGQNRLF